MLKFFRNIRQKLLIKNNFSKYLIYAIGEIVLVVIGILIALQINNWNEEKKDNAFENEMLTQIHENLTNDKKALKKIKFIFNDAISSSNNILKLEKNGKNSDSLKYWLADIIQFERFQPITNSYETLKLKGLDKISDKKLRILLGEYYDDEINHVIKSVGDLEHTFNNHWLPLLKEIIIDFKFQDYVIVSDPTIFNQPSIARNILILNKDNYRGGLNQVNKAISKIDKLEEILEKIVAK